jgi:hypothetical protein
MRLAECQVLVFLLFESHRRVSPRLVAGLGETGLRGSDLKA